ncbi:MAG: DUF4175 family protein, partial [Pseudomonadota bacterium]
MSLPAPVPLLRTYAVLTWERVYPAFLPAGIAAFFYTAAGLMGWLARAPLWAHTGGLGIALITLGFLTWRAMRQFQWPTRREVLRRIEQHNDLVIGCLDALEAEPFAADENDPLWIAARERLVAAIGRPKLPALSVNVQKVDPIRLRYLALVALLGAAAFNRGDVSGLEASLTPVFPERPPIAVDTWIEPPAYTGLPPRVLKGHIRYIHQVPEGSILHLRLRDEMGAPAKGVVTFASADSGKR